jgi:hypothetical protein
MRFWGGGLTGAGDPSPPERTVISFKEGVNMHAYKFSLKSSG